MNTERLRYLYQQYQLGQLSQAESQEWETAIADLSNDASLLSMVDKDWDLEDFKAPILVDGEQEKIFNYVVAQPQNRRIMKRLWPRIAAAASIVLAIGAGIFFYANQSKNSAVQTGNYANDVAPGKQGATLTLASGRQIRLSDAANGELVKEAGVVITKSATGQLVYELKDSESGLNKTNTLSTAKGETYQVRLPDGSLVWLNAASSLTYSAALTERRQRRVKLSGEAYFEVAKDKTHPFVVESKGQEVQVLGTHFNVNSYANEPNTETTLLEGSVSVNGKTVLKPGEQSVLAEGKISVLQVDAENFVDWKNGEFVFVDEPLGDILRKVSRWYDVEFVVVDQKALSNTFTGSVSRSDKVSGVLRVLQKASKVRFKIEGKVIRIE